jgi:hypothetical protein
MRELAVIERIKVHLAMLQVALLEQAIGIETAFDLLANRMVGADGSVGVVLPAEGLLRDLDVEAAIEIADGPEGRVVEVVPANSLHDHRGESSPAF